jgi:hypothetical protein
LDRSESVQIAALRDSFTNTNPFRVDTERQQVIRQLLLNFAQQENFEQKVLENVELASLMDEWHLGLDIQLLLGNLTLPEALRHVSTQLNQCLDEQAYLASTRQFLAQSANHPIHMRHKQLNNGCSLLRNILAVLVSEDAKNFYELNVADKQKVEAMRDTLADVYDNSQALSASVRVSLRLAVDSHLVWSQLTMQQIMDKLLSFDCRLDVLSIINGSFSASQSVRTATHSLVYDLQIRDNILHQMQQPSIQKNATRYQELEQRLPSIDSNISLLRNILSIIVTAGEKKTYMFLDQFETESIDGLPNHIPSLFDNHDESLVSGETQSVLQDLVANFCQLEDDQKTVPLLEKALAGHRMYSLALLFRGVNKHESISILVQYLGTFLDEKSRLERLVQESRTPEVDAKLQAIDIRVDLCQNMLSAIFTNSPTKFRDTNRSTQEEILNLLDNLAGSQSDQFDNTGPLPTHVRGAIKNAVISRLVHPPKLTVPELASQLLIRGCDLDMDRLLYGFLSESQSVRAAVHCLNVSHAKSLELDKLLQQSTLTALERRSLEQQSVLIESQVEFARDVVAVIVTKGTQKEHASLSNEIGF